MKISLVILECHLPMHKILARMVRIWFPSSSDEWTSTCLDILEEGDVPLLMSMEQMQNLYLNLAFEPGKVLATCKSFNDQQEPLSISTSGHAVMDLVIFSQTIASEG